MAGVTGPNRCFRKLTRDEAPALSVLCMSRAVGYNYEAVKIFMPANREKPVIVPYIEHVPPDVTAGIFWLKRTRSMLT